MAIFHCYVSSPEGKLFWPQKNSFQFHTFTQKLCAVQPAGCWKIPATRMSHPKIRSSPESSPINHFAPVFSPFFQVGFRFAPCPLLKVVLRLLFRLFLFSWPTRSQGFTPSRTGWPRSHAVDHQTVIQPSTLAFIFQKRDLLRDIIGYYRLKVVLLQISPNHIKSETWKSDGICGSSPTCSLQKIVPQPRLSRSCSVAGLHQGHRKTCVPGKCFFRPVKNLESSCFLLLIFPGNLIMD